MTLKEMLWKPLPNEVLFVVSAIFITTCVVASLFMSANASRNDFADWQFHNCFASSFNAVACSEQASGFVAYYWYSPLAHVLARLFSFPVLAAAITGGIALLSIVLSKSLWGWGLFLLGSTWLDDLYTGILPFYLFLVFLLFMFAFWDRFETKHKFLVVGLGLFTHFYGGLFLVFAAVMLSWFNKRNAFIVVFAAALLLTLVPGYERAWILVLLLLGVGVGFVLQRLPAWAQAGAVATIYGLGWGAGFLP